MRVADLALLVVSVALLAGASAVVKWLQVEQPLMVDAEAISFCNVLFVGNLVAGLVALVSFRPAAIARELRSADRGTWAMLAGNGVLAVLIPSLLFTALEHTSVTNVVLLGRFESVAFALLSALILRQALGRGPWLGYAVIALGTLGLVLAQTDWKLMTGEGLVLGAAVLQGAAALFARRTLERTSLGAFVFVRNAASALVFFVLALALFGWEHFAHAFGPRLWVMMLVYAGVVIVIGQSAWYRSLARLPGSVVANASMSAPAFGLLFAFVLLDEVPSTVQWIGAAIIAVGMALTRVGARERALANQVERSLAGG